MENNLGYCIFQNTPVDCKKDNSEVLQNTTSPKIKDDLNKIISSWLVDVMIDSCNQELY